MNRFLAAALVAATATLFSLPVLATSLTGPDWTGFYAGVQGGAGWTTIDESAQGGALHANQSGDGALGGGHAGYDWHIGRMVVGLEGDLAAANLTGHTVCPQPSLTCSHKIDWLATVRPRAGFLVLGDRLLLYGTGGLAFAHIKYRETYNSTGALYGTGYSKTHTGWTVGGGIEYLVIPHLSLRFQYLHDEFQHVTTAAETLSHNAVHISPSLDEAEIGLSYRF